MALTKIKCKGKAETILEIALALALLRPDWKSLLPSPLNGSEVGIHNATDPYIAAKQTSSANGTFNPLNEFTSWESLGDNVQFSNDMIAMLNTVLNENPDTGSCDESGYSSENPSSPSASSCTGSVSFMPSNDLMNDIFVDQSCLGATGFTPPREDGDKVPFYEKLDLEDFVDLSGIETPPVEKQPWNWPVNLQVDLDNSYEDSFCKIEESKDCPMLTNASGKGYFDSKISVDDDILLQTPLDFHSQDSFDPYSIDFALKSDPVVPEVDYDSIASYLGELDLPLDILDTSYAGTPAMGIASGNGTEVPPTGSAINTTVESDDVKPQILTIKKEPGTEETKESRDVRPTVARSKKVKQEPHQVELTNMASEEDIIDMPVVKFNEYLETLSESQAMIAKDARRRGKNKEAARICRKRKMDTIADLEEEIALIKSKKELLLKENRLIDDESSDLKQKIGVLYNYVFESLRDENGQPLSPSEHSLLHAANGCLYLVPNSSNTKKSLKVK